MSDERILKFTLPSGIEVEMDLNRFNVRTVMEARTCANGGFKTTLFILEKICKFNGKTLTAPELEELDGFDFIELEDQWNKARNLVKKPPVPQTSSTSPTSQDGAKKKS